MRAFFLQFLYSWQSGCFALAKTIVLAKSQFLLVYLLIFVPFMLYATPNFLAQNPQYKDYIKEAILYDYTQDTNTFKQVKQKWQTRKDLRIRIFGDSHIAGDFITSELRTIVGNVNALGFLYPLMPPYHQTLLLEYENKEFEIIDSRKTREILDFPMGGIIAYPKTLPATITLKINPKQIQDSNDTFITQIIFKNNTNTKALAIKDSKNKNYTLQAQHPNKWEIAMLRLTFPIEIEALNENVMLGGYFIFKERENTIIEHLGINGVRSDIWKKWDKDIFMQQLSILNYDIIMLCYGSNDAMFDVFNEEKFIENYRNFITILRHNNPNALIILLSPPPVLFPAGASKEKYQQSKIFVPIKQTIKKIAQMEKVMLFDMDYFIQKTGTKEEWTKKNLSKKDVHLTPHGYRLIAHGIYETLAKVLESY